MRWSYFRQSRQFGDTGTPWVTWLVAIAAASLWPLIAILFGLVLTQTFLGTASMQLPTDWVLGPWVHGDLISWPVHPRREVAVLILVGATAGVSLVAVAFALLLIRSAESAAQARVDALQQAIHRQAYAHGASELLGSRRSGPTLLMTETVGQIRRGLVAWWQTIPYAVVAVLGLLVVAMIINLWLTLLALLMAFVVWRLRAWVRSRSSELSARHDDRAQQARGVMLETVRLAPLSSGYLIDDFPGASFDENLRHYSGSTVRAAVARGSVEPRVAGTTVLAVAFLLLIAGLAPQSSIVGTSVLAFALVAAYFPARSIWLLGSVLDEADDAAHHVFTFLNRKPSVSQLADAKPLDRIREKIAFQNVTLSDRGGVKLLEGLTVELAAGKRYALLAADPATAKATCGLLVRYYDPTAGRVLYDDQDIGRATLDTVRGQALLVDHRAELFTGTVLDNITCGDSGFTMLQISDAARVAGVHDFIQELPQAYHTIVGPHGTRVDAAQSFLIALARAIIRNPSLLIVEEPQEVLEEDDGRLVDTTMERIGADRTLIVLPGRIHSLRKADRVLCIQRGKLVGDGTHAELLQNNELYRHLNYVRFNPFRLETASP